MATAKETRRGSGAGKPKKKSTTKSETPTKPPESTFDTVTMGASELIENLAQRVSGIVGRSAAILEEEIAAGILAAKKVEENFLDVEALRGGNEKRFSRRMRRDFHEVIDIIVDLIESGMKSAGVLAQRAVRIGPLGGFGHRPPAPGNIPTLSAKSPLEPGNTAEISMTLENDSDVETDEFHFNSSDLINAASGDKISSNQIKVSPSPVTIAPKGVSNVIIYVEVPADTASGVYSGLLQATKLDKLRAILTVQVS